VGGGGGGNLSELRASQHCRTTHGGGSTRAAPTPETCNNTCSGHGGGCRCQTEGCSSSVSPVAYVTYLVDHARQRQRHRRALDEHDAAAGGMATQHGGERLHLGGVRWRGIVQGVLDALQMGAVGRHDCVEGPRRNTALRQWVMGGITTGSDGQVNLHDCSAHTHRAHPRDVVSPRARSLQQLLSHPVDQSCSVYEEREGKSAPVFRGSGGSPRRSVRTNDFAPSSSRRQHAPFCKRL